MKKYFVIVLVLLLGSCTDKMALVDGILEQAGQVPASEFDVLVEKARQGDGNAYLELADCYRDGKGVEKDFVGMCYMAELAEEYGGIRHAADYFATLPEGSEYRLIFYAGDMFKQGKWDELRDAAERLLAQGSAEGYTMKGLLAASQGDGVEGKRLFEIASQKGSILAELLLCFPEWPNEKNVDAAKLAALADKNPMVSEMVAETYAGCPDASKNDDNLAVHFFLKADKNACLSKRGISWLLRYHDGGKYLHLSDSELDRLHHNYAVSPLR